MKTLETNDVLKASFEKYPRELIPLRVERNGEGYIVPVSRAFFEQHLAADVVAYAEDFSDRSLAHAEEKRREEEATQ